MVSWIDRYYEKAVLDSPGSGKIVILYGPRRVGKTSLVERILSNSASSVLSVTGDDRVFRDLIASEHIQNIKSALSGYDILFIDEAQRIENIGFGLKIIADYVPDVQCIATGSSSFGLSRQIGEPLTGRYIRMILYPVAMLEYATQFGGMEIMQRLDQFMIFGSYPEVVCTESRQDRMIYLNTLRDSYLLKDILELENLRNASKLWDLLKLLAFQIGKEVSLNELSRNLGIAKQTVERYLYILEQSFVIKKAGGFSRNLRKEVSKTARYYFWDNGVRNSVINNFNALDTRDDIGMLWENLMFIERMKKQEYYKLLSTNYFWRTYDQKEIDLVEERDGRLFGYEFKWTDKKVKPPRLWFDTYDNASFEVVNKANFLPFVS